MLMLLDLKCRVGNFELPFHIRDHHVLDFELCHGVGRVDAPGGG